MPSKNVSGYNVLNFPPLLAGYKYKRAWNTNIMSTLTGWETRTSLREDIVKALSVTIELDEYDEIMALKKILFFSLNKSYAVPLWHYKTTATGATGTTISMDTRYIELEAGDQVLLTDGVWNNYEKQEVASLNDTSVTTSTTISGGWSSGVSVYPLLISQVDDLQAITPGVGNNIDIISIKMDFTETFRLEET